MYRLASLLQDERGTETPTEIDAYGCDGLFGAVFPSDAFPYGWDGPTPWRSLSSDTAIAGVQVGVLATRMWEAQNLFDEALASWRELLREGDSIEALACSGKIYDMITQVSRLHVEYGNLPAEARRAYEDHKESGRGGEEYWGRLQGPRFVPWDWEAELLNSEAGVES